MASQRLQTGLRRLPRAEAAQGWGQEPPHLEARKSIRLVGWALWAWMLLGSEHGDGRRHKLAARDFCNVRNVWDMGLGGIVHVNPC